MSVALLDVNVLVALFDTLHANHEQAHHWFGLHRKHGWATCPVTVNGCIRVLSNPSYPTLTASPADVAERLRDLCHSAHHHFWPGSVSLVDESLFHWAMINGHQKVTDVYLLGLAVRNHGRLVTFDQSIPLKAVGGAVAANMVVPAGN